MYNVTTTEGISSIQDSITFYLSQHTTVILLNISRFLLQKLRKIRYFFYIDELFNIFSDFI